MANESEFPTELSGQPIGFVALTGLDTTYNAVHLSIWELFNSNRNRTDRVPIRFQIFPGDHEYPKPKPKRVSYEWYLPKGILKTNWMAKYLQQVPSLVVIFFDMDWDDPAWNEKILECAAKVHVVRSALDGRNTKVVVVLIQKNAPFPPGEDALANSRAETLCTKCDLNRRSLYVLPHGDHLLGYILRLESALYEMAQAYYVAEARRVRAHRDLLNKPVHQTLKIRHQFKIAFFNEIKQDFIAALKHYKQAYTMLLELRTGDGNLMEVKTVAGIISYKMCKISFQMNTPLDAIGQLRRHIDIFKNKIGPLDIIFEHSAWLSKQFALFGDLFDEAVRAGLTPHHTQHPGFYYQQAALHAANRKKQCQLLCRGMQNPPTNPIGISPYLEFYGQRPWRQGTQVIDPIDIILERDGIAALQHREVTAVNHSTIVIGLLNNAINQFKKYRSPRMKRYLVVQMAEEYFDARDYSKTLTLLSHVMWDYRQEKWWSLLTSIINVAIRASYLVANVQEYVTMCMEMLGKYIIGSHEDKLRIQNNLLKVLQGQVPECETGVSESILENVAELWKRELKSTGERIPLTVDATQILAFVECRPRFKNVNFAVDTNVILNVTLRVFCPAPIRFTKLSLHLSNETYDKHCCAVDKESVTDTATENEIIQEADLNVVPGIDKIINFTFLPDPEDTWQNIQILSAVLKLSRPEGNYDFLMKWNWPNAEQNSGHVDISGVNLSKLKDDHRNLQTKILHRESKLRLDVEHESPALENEYFPLKVKLTNNELCAISQIKLTASLQETNEQHLETVKNTTFLMTDLNQASGAQPSTTTASFDVGSLEVSEEVQKSFYLKSASIGDRTIVVNVTYDIILEVEGQERTYHNVKEEEITIPVVNAFSITTNQLSMKLTKLDHAHIDEPLLLLIKIDCTSPWPVIILDSKLHLTPNYKFNSVSRESQLRDVTVSNEDLATECHCIIAPKIQLSPTSLGTFVLQWKRASGCEVPSTTTEVTLAGFEVSPVPLYIKAEVPTHGWVRTPFTITYRLHNRTQTTQDFTISMDSCDAFMFAGHKQVHYRVLPDDELVLRYNLYPLNAGWVGLPILRIQSADQSSNSEIENLLTQQLFPSQIFIMPQVKTQSAKQPTLSQA